MADRASDVTVNWHEVCFFNSSQRCMCHRFYLSLTGRWLEHWAHGDVYQKLGNGSFGFVESDVYSQWM